jgi:WD40 repeat protein
MGNSAGKKDKNKVVLLETCDEHDGSINCFALSEDESVLATGSDDKSIRLWSTTGKIECIGVCEGHTDYITSLLIQDNFVLSSCADKTVCKWDMSTCECVLVYAGHTSTVNKVLVIGDFLFSISYDKTVRCWDFESGECIRVFVGHKNNVSSIIFIPCEKYNMEKALKAVQASKHKSLNKNPDNLNPSDDDDDDNDDSDDEDDEDDDVYSKDIIITGSLDTFAKSWSFESGECIYTFSGHTGAITCLAIDEIGRLLFTGSSDHTIRSWDIFRGYPLKVFEGHQTTIISLVVS